MGTPTITGSFNKPETIADLSSESSPTPATTAVVLTCKRTVGKSAWYRVDAPSVADSSYFKTQDYDNNLYVKMYISDPLPGSSPVRRASIRVSLPIANSVKADPNDQRNTSIDISFDVPVAAGIADDSSNLAISDFHLVYQLAASLMSDDLFIANLAVNGVINPTYAASNA